MQTIMIVDDEPGVLDVLEESLTQAGYAVIPRADAESALAVIRKGTAIDLVITDNLLPGMKGDEFIDLLTYLLPSVPVIMLTAYGSVESYIQSMAKGLFEYVNKPVQRRELQRIIKAALDWAEDRHPQTKIA